MTVDWLTVVAQIINFVVLILLLYRLLYGPIVKAMQEREARIAARLQEAEAARRRAAEEADAYRSKHAELDNERKERLAKIQEEADARADEMLEEARCAIDERKAEWEQTLSRDRARFLAELEQQISAEVFAIARRALQDIADGTLERQAALHFLDEIRSADRDTWQAFLQSLGETQQSVTVRSAFDLPEDLRKEIEVALTDGAGAARPDEDRAIHVHFAVEPELIAGLELQAHSHIAAWNLRDYLAALETRVASLLNAQDEHEHERTLDQDAA